MQKNYGYNDVINRAAMVCGQRRGGREIWGHYGPLQGLPTEGAGTEILSGAHQ